MADQTKLTASQARTQLLGITGEARSAVRERVLRCGGESRAWEGMLHVRHVERDLDSPIGQEPVKDQAEMVEEICGHASDEGLDTRGVIGRGEARQVIPPDHCAAVSHGHVPITAKFPAGEILRDDVALKSASSRPQAPSAAHGGSAGRSGQHGEVIGLAERSRFQPEAEPAQVAVAILPVATNCHGGVNCLGCHPLAVVDDVKRPEIAILANQTDEYIGSPSVDGVVHEIGEGCLEGVVSPQTLQGARIRGQIDRSNDRDGLSPLIPSLDMRDGWGHRRRGGCERRRLDHGLWRN